MKKGLEKSNERNRRFFKNNRTKSIDFDEAIVEEKVYMITNDKEKSSKLAESDANTAKQAEVFYANKEAEFSQAENKIAVSKDADISSSSTKKVKHSIKERKEAFLQGDVVDEIEEMSKNLVEVQNPQKLPKEKKKRKTKRQEKIEDLDGDRQIIDKDGTVIVSPANNGRKKLNVFDKFFISIWAFTCMIITKSAEAINSVVAFIFKKGIPIKYVKAFVAIVIIVCILLAIILPSTVGRTKVEESADIYSDGLLAAKILTWPDGSTEGINKWGYINRKGKTIISAIYDDAMPFRYGSAFVRTGEYWQLIGKNGKLKTETKFIVTPQNPDPVGQFGIDVKLAKVCQNGKYGFITPSGKLAITPQFDGAGYFIDGLACVKLGVRMFYINKAGKTIGSHYEEVRQISSGLGAVKNSGSWGFVNKKGAMVIDAKFDEVTDFYGDYAVIRSGTAVGIINKKGSFVVDPLYVDFNSDNTLIDYFKIFGLI